MTTLFDSIRVGDLDLANRIAQVAGWRRGADAVHAEGGRPFICNPDLMRRLRENAPLTPLDTSTPYGCGASGYIDYPTLDLHATA